MILGSTYGVRDIPPEQRKYNKNKKALKKKRVVRRKYRVDNYKKHRKDFGG